MKELPKLIDGQRLPLSKAVNFRDIDGNQTFDHRTVKKGLVYSSYHLSRLTSQDQQLPQRFRFKAVCDLRKVREQHNSPYLLPLDGSIRLLSKPVEAHGFDPATVTDRLKAEDDAWLSIDFFK